MAVEKRFSISLDVKQPTSNRDIEVVEGDTGNILIVTLTDNGQAVNLTDCKVCAVFAKPNGKTAMQDTDGNGLTVAGEEMNEITIELYNTSFSPGMVTCEIQVFSGESMGTLITSAQFNFKCRRGIANEDTIQSTDEWPMLVDMIQRVEAAEDELVVLTEQSTEATARANESADRATAAAEDAEEIHAIASEAEAERQRRFAGITAKAHPLPAGYDPTANWNDSGDLPVLELGMPKPKDGKDAVNVAVNGMFHLEIEDGNLYAVVADGAAAPPLAIDENGDLIYTIA